MRDLIYIMAPSYTGSTLLTCLLATHPNIGTIGELKATSMGDIDKYVCSCGALIRECGFWRRVKEEMEGGDAHFTLDYFGTNFRADSFLCDHVIRAGVRGRLFEVARSFALRLLPGCERRLRNILQQNRLLIEVISDIQHGDVFLDGSKDPIRLKHLLSGGYWNVRVIYLIRDGRGATNSYMRHHDVPIETAAREWIYTSRECDLMLSRLEPRALLTVHYEELCQDPSGVLGRIYEFLGLEPGLGSINYQASKYHILGNAMRLKSTREIRLDEKWKRSLTHEDLEGFERIAGRINRSYGYE